MQCFYKVSIKVVHACFDQPKTGYAYLLVGFPAVKMEQRSAWHWLSQPPAVQGRPSPVWLLLQPAPLALALAAHTHHTLAVHEMQHSYPQGSDQAATVLINHCAVVCIEPRNDQGEASHSKILGRADMNPFKIYHVDTTAAHRLTSMVSSNKLRAIVAFKHEWARPFTSCLCLAHVKQRNLEGAGKLHALHSSAAADVS